MIEHFWLSSGTPHMCLCREICAPDGWWPATEETRLLGDGRVHAILVGSV
jgi:hypothetical protein